DFSITSSSSAFKTQGDDIIFRSARFPARKIQDFWAAFAERYTGVEQEAMKQDREGFRRGVEDTLAGVCEMHGMSFEIGRIIGHYYTEMGLKTSKPEHQDAVDRLLIEKYSHAF